MSGDIFQVEDARIFAPEPDAASRRASSIPPGILVVLIGSRPIASIRRA
jgi:hypothetical protein